MTSPRLQTAKPYVGLVLIYYVTWALADFFFHMEYSTETWGQAIGVAGLAFFATFLIHLEVFGSWWRERL